MKKGTYDVIENEKANRTLQKKKGISDFMGKASEVGPRETNVKDSDVNNANAIFLSISLK